MHCPNCGNESDLDQKFCRKCGFNLEPVSKLVAAGPYLETKSEKLEGDQAILRRMYRWMNQDVPISLPSVTERTTQLIAKDANQKS